MKLRKVSPPKKKKAAAKKRPKEKKAVEKTTLGPVPGYSQVKVVLVNTQNKLDTLLRKLQKYEGLIGFDTEVVGPNLRGQDFVNISHASLLGMSLAFEDEKTYYIPVRHKGNNLSFMGIHLIFEELRRAAKDHRVIAHNAKFDHQVVLREGYELPGMLDSMVAAWLRTGRNNGLGLKQLAEDVLGRTSPKYDPAIHAKTGDEVKIYAGHDALNTLQLGKHYHQGMDPWEWYLEECDFTLTLAKMKLLGMNIDRKRLRKLRDTAKHDLAEVEADWNTLAPDIKITSSKALQHLFEDGTWTPHGSTSGGQLSTGKLAMQWNAKNAQTEAGRRLAELRLKYQEIAKIVTTYTDGLIEEALQWADKKLHCDLHHFGTVTGRLAASNPNLQNQPAHGQWATLVRECYIPDPGKEFTSADYSQIELRYFAEYCGGKLLEAYTKGLDIHQMTADAMGITRQQGKMVNFGFLLYGGGPKKLADELGISLSEAEEKIKALHEQYPEVEEWRRTVIEAVGGLVEWNDYGQPEIVGGRCPIPWATTLVGRKRYFPELNPELLKVKNPEEYDRLAKHYEFKCRQRGRKPTAVGLWMSIRSRGERLVVNYLIQGGTRDLLVMGMNHYRKVAPEGFDLVMTVHDEVLTQHPAGEGEVARQLLQESLEHVGARLRLEVPIVAEPKTGKNWAEVK